MNIKTFLLFVSLLTSLTSCMFTEEIHLNNDGSGNYSFKIDMSEMMKSMSEMKSNDSLKEPEVVDTIVFFKDVLEEHKDSISKLSEHDKATLEALQDLKLHMEVDEKKNKMIMDFIMDFSDISKLKNIEQKIAKAQALQDKKNNDNQIPSKSDVNYLFDGKIFKRKVVLKDLTEERRKKIDASIQQSGSFLDGSQYRIVYHFEKRIKSVSIKSAQISQDGKTMTVVFPMDTLVKNPQLLDFEVKLK